MKLADVKVRDDGTPVYTLGPIRLLRPLDRAIWHVLYNRLHWQWVYKWLWRKYARA